MVGVAAWNQLKALGVTLWANRTKAAGYLGVALGTLQVLQGQPMHTLLLGTAVALIGHYNDYAARA